MDAKFNKFNNVGAAIVSQNAYSPALNNKLS
jgi:hypothetical protein